MFKLHDSARATPTAYLSGGPSVISIHLALYPIPSATVSAAPPFPDDHNEFIGISALFAVDVHDYC